VIVMRQVIFAAALLVAGCGSKPDLACDQIQKSGFVTVHLCTDFYNLASSQLAEAEKSCAAQHGTLVDACATDSEVGVCTISQGGASADLHMYSGGGLTSAIGKSACDQVQGSWSGS
jgi:hypothetical protein